MFRSQHTDMFCITKEMMSEAIGTESKETGDTVLIETVLEELVNSKLTQRIVEAARLAAARHMVQEAQEIQSAVETEVSVT